MKKIFILIAFVYCSFGFSQDNPEIKIKKQAITEFSISENANFKNDKAEILARMNWSKEDWDDKISTRELSLMEKAKIKAIIDSLRNVRKEKGL